jgi:hypothetical protein
MPSIAEPDNAAKKFGKNRVAVTIERLIDRIISA